MIEVICGPMFSGKTEELIRRLKRVKIAGLSCIVFKPTIESRYPDEVNGIATHDNESKIEAKKVSIIEEIFHYGQNYDVIAIDEAQFFEAHLFEVALALNDLGKRIIISGLDLDYERKPFVTMSFLLSVATKINKLTSVCMKCKNAGNLSLRKTNDKKQKIIGANDLYMPVCNNCYIGKDEKRTKINPN